MAAPTSPDAIRDVNTRYHDGAAADYDAKWGIDWGQTGREQVLGKLRKALGGALPVFDRSLEVGAGTGYFSLHLLMSGVVARATCTDISPGMIEALQENADRLGLEVAAQVADAEALPFEDESFDIVVGHAVLHHLPDLAQAFAEFHRVLKPGGTIVFAGEPSRYGDRLAGVPKRAATAVAPLWRAALRASAAAPGHTDGGEENHELERHVDVHAFVPGDLETVAPRRRLRRGARPRRGAARQLVRLDQPRAGIHRGGRRGAVGVEAVRLPRLPRAAGGRSAGARGPPARRGLLQPAAERAQAGLTGRQVCAATAR